MILGVLSEKIYASYFMLGDFIYAFYLNYARTILDAFHYSFRFIFDGLIYLAVALGLFYMFMAIFVLFRKKKTEKAIPEGKEPMVTIQIPTYNELAAINCAKKCLEFDYPKDKYEIIIGDDSKDPSVSAMIDEFAKKHSDRIKVTRRGNNIGFKPGNLNHMLKFTKGDYIVIFDSDFLPESDFLKRIIAPFHYDKKISTVQARWEPLNFSQNFISVMAGTIQLVCHHVVLPFISSKGGNVSLCGSAEAVKKTDLLRLGGWMNGSLTEDIEYSLRLIKEGKKLIHLDTLECKMEVPFTLKDISKQQMRWAFGVISSIKTHFADLYLRRNTKMDPKDRTNVFIFASGYLFTIFLITIAATGILSFISDKPAPIEWMKVFSETGKYILLTSGFLFTNAVTLGISGKYRNVPRMLASCLSVGFVVTYYVNVGIAKAIFDREMQWFMLNKNGNKVVI